MNRAIPRVILITIISLTVAVACEQPSSLVSIETIDPARGGHHGGGCQRLDFIRTMYASAFIDAQSGGVFEFPSGSLAVPPSSLAQDTMLNVEVTMSRVGNQHRFVYEFGPSGTTFDPAATLSLSYDRMGSVDRDSLLLLYWDENIDAWVVASHMILDPSTRRYVGEISHFSRYALSANGQSVGKLD